MKKLIVIFLVVSMAGGSIASGEVKRFSFRKKEKDKKQILREALRRKDQKAVQKLVMEIGPELGRKEWDYLLVRTSAEGWMEILDKLLRLHRLYPEQFPLDVSANNGELYNAPILFAQKYKKPHVVLILLPILLREGNMPLSMLKEIIKWLDKAGEVLTIYVLKVWRDRAYESLQRFKSRHHFIEKGLDSMEKLSDNPPTEELIEIIEEEPPPTKEELAWLKQFRKFDREMRQEEFDSRKMSKLNELEEVYDFLNDKVKKRTDEERNMLEERFKMWKKDNKKQQKI